MFFRSSQQRPFLNFYGPTFILYELSSPFLNIHWFLDKLRLTGSRLQWYNGILLLTSFFCCRLIWGTYQSIRVYQDVWRTLHLPPSASPPKTANHASSDMMRFATNATVPRWLAATYLASNIILNALNFYWFGKMIETVRKRFEDPPSGKTDPAAHSTTGPQRPRRGTGLESFVGGDVGLEGMDGPVTEYEILETETSTDPEGKVSAVEASKTEVRKRRT